MEKRQCEKMYIDDPNCSLRKENQKENKQVYKEKTIRKKKQYQAQENISIVPKNQKEQSKKTNDYIKLKKI